MSSRMESFLPSAEHSWKTCVLRSQQSRNKIYQCFTSTWLFHCYSLSIFILFQNQRTLTTSFKVPFMGIIIPCSVFYDYYSYKAYILSFILAFLAQRLQCKWQLNGASWFTVRSPLADKIKPQEHVSNRHRALLHLKTSEMCSWYLSPLITIISTVEFVGFPGTCARTAFGCNDLSNLACRINW